MSGLVQVDINDVLQGLDELQRRGQDLKPVFRALKPKARVDLRSHFETNLGPTGMWAPRSAASRAKMLASHRATWTMAGAGMFGFRRKKASSAHSRRGKIKKRAQKRLDNQLGRLKSAWSYRITRWSFEARSIVPWAGVHQEGGPVGHGARVPGRTFAWFSDLMIDGFVRAAKRYILAAWFKTRIQSEIF